MRIYLHSRSSELKLIEVDERSTVGDLARGHGPAPDASVWIEDADGALALDATLADAGIPERGHVHVSTCPRILVRVRYGDSKSKEFPPGTTIARVFAWATGKDGFDLTPSQRAKHTLGVCDTLTEPDKSEHVGTLADEDCGLCLDLEAKERFEG